MKTKPTSDPTPSAISKSRSGPSRVPGGRRIRRRAARGSTRSAPSDRMRALRQLTRERDSESREPYWLRAPAPCASPALPRRQQYGSPALRVGREHVDSGVSRSIGCPGSADIEKGRVGLSFRAGSAPAGRPMRGLKDPGYSESIGGTALLTSTGGPEEEGVKRGEPGATCPMA
jgi:hypothetical protein